MPLIDLLSLRPVDELNRFLSRESIPTDMRRRLREYFHQSKHLRLAQTQRALISDMSPHLSRQVAWIINEGWLTRIWFLRNAPRTFMIDLASRMEARVFPPGDSPAIGFMYIVHRGIAMHNAKLITKGNVWGEDIILSSKVLRSKAQARAMNYLEVYFTTRTVLMYLSRIYPKTGMKVRKAAIMLALRREVIRFAKSRLQLASQDLIAKAVRAKQLIDGVTLGSADVANAAQQKMLAGKVDWRRNADNDEKSKLDQEEDGDESEEEPIVEDEWDIETRGRGFNGGGMRPRSPSPVGGGMRPPSPSPVPLVVRPPSPSPGVPGSGGGSLSWLNGGGGNSNSASASLEKRLTEQMAMLQKVLENQNSLKREVAHQRSESQAVANSLRSLQTWIINDRLSVAKLQA